MEILTLCLALVFGTKNYENASGTIHENADRHYNFQTIYLDILGDDEVNSVSFLVDGELVKELTLAKPYWETLETREFPFVAVWDWRDYWVQNKSYGFTQITIGLGSVIGKRCDLIIDGEISKASIVAIYAVPEPPSILVLLMFVFIYYCVRT
jgi:hypothetical protein